MNATLKKIQAKRASQEINGGFTLIELLIVIVVLGILAAVVVFSLSGVTASSAVAACQSDGASVNTALVAYSAQNGGATPSSIASLSPTYLQTVPTSSHYKFAIVGGALYEAAGTTTTVASSSAVGWTAWATNGAGTCTTSSVS